MSEAAPFEEAAGHAMQAAAMSIRFLVSVSRVLADRTAADAARLDRERAAQVDRLQQVASPVEDVAERYARIVREEVTNPGIREALLSTEQWPQIADDLHVLERAGVNVRELLADASRTADRIAASLTTRPQNASEYYAQMVREHVPDARVREPLLNSDRWPQIADQMRQLDAAGVDVPQLLNAASTAGVSLHTTLQQAWERMANRADRLSAETAPEPERTSRAQVGNPRGRGREDSALRNRASGLREAGLSNQESQRYVRMVRETIRDEHRASMLVVSRQWPQIAAQMRNLEARGIDPAARLARLPQEIARLAATGQRVNIALAAADVLSKPAPATASTPSAPTQRPAATTSTSTSTTRAAPEPKEATTANLRQAVEIGAAREMVHPVQLTRAGMSENQAGLVVAELRARGIIGPAEMWGTRQMLVSQEEAFKRLGIAVANPSVPAPVAAVASTQAQPAPVSQAPTATEVKTKGSEPADRAVQANAANAHSTTTSAPPTAPTGEPAPAATASPATAPAREVRQGPRR